MLMTKDESTLITGDYGDSVIVWDMSSGERKSTLKADGEVRCFASCGGALWCVDCGCGAGAERVGLALWSPILRQAGRRSASACACCRVCGWWCAFAMGGFVCAVCRVLLVVSRLRRVCGRVARWHGDGHGVGACGVHMVAFCGCVLELLGAFAVRWHVCVVVGRTCTCVRRAALMASSRRCASGR